MRLRLAIWFLLMSGICALGLGNNGVPPFFGVPAANFSTWNPADKSANITLSGGNLIAQATNTTDGAVRGTVSRNAGKLLVEYIFPSALGTDTGAGIANSSAVLGSVGVNATNAFILFSSGNIWFNGSFTGISSTLTIGSAGNCMAIDFGNSRGWFRSGTGNWNGSGTPNPSTNTSGINISTLFPSTAAFPVTSSNVASNPITINVGASAFSSCTGATVSGFSAWGYLLYRDLAPANHNRPMFTEAVA